ncbi:MULTISPECIES: prepilin peptidase [Legionella]|uniref:Prepilin leader peptidase/N-methyltransferase n=1 Tax=Legionella septentrionalis TaxID=2498109 RepID=A0A3S0V4D5_9GAMM|nr:MULTISPECIES: A24 family peptidase [Legionella]MCP0913281.1 A24 family peptidase [Legionella sp. 27cVA30]RUQ79575.1 prepilin peptidase [Legionella septentrionalis]RUQ97964.1 prepilin peptidase [Legionella septentrionalis]RUR08826.1 prepilin peptidase [Legionella septentrionalis]RUR14709.1 prepilin peptidase [Legionella septentrionalis]
MLNEITQASPLALHIFLALFFLAVGSLLNVVIYRLPLMLKAEWLAECRCLLELPAEPTARINLFLPRSFCPGCKTTIPFWHNIPLLSYCVLRGKCSHCETRIPLRYPLVELLSLLLSFLAFWHFGISLSFVFSLLFIWLLLIICFIDIQHQLLPDPLSLSLLWLGLIANTQSLFTSLPDAVLSAAAAYMSLWLFIKLFYWFTGKIGMGHGDFKLFAAFGAWFGWMQLPFILLLSSVIGGIFGIIYLKTTKQTKETPIAFGPFLCLAGLVSLFYGENIIRWYLKLYI